MTKILVVDDHDSFRRTVCFILRKNSFEICGEAETGEEAVKKVTELTPDVVILDARLRGGMDGFQVAREIRHIAPSIKILLFSIHDTPNFVEAAREAGADASLSKFEGGSRLVEEINRLL